MHCTKFLLHCKEILSGKCSEEPCTATYLSPTSKVDRCPTVFAILYMSSSTEKRVSPCFGIDSLRDISVCVILSLEYRSMFYFLITNLTPKQGRRLTHISDTPSRSPAGDVMIGCISRCTCVFVVSVSVRNFHRC